MLMSFLVSCFYGFVGSCGVILFSMLILRVASHFNMDDNFWINSIMDVSDVCSWIMFIIFSFFGIFSLLINTYKSIKKQYRNDNISIAQDVNVINEPVQKGD
ncbi:hypothetical protein MmiHf6_00160 [Methanimicrococcus hongohii]|uniref:Uncharacterized protein n=1 Tax=Methanimicrococcus hongohii TaxID=3028295 RepID=A0AA96ZT37_9EURY|nr:hypothetical protein MmiHf6_00160 [Methanimicrococcus sp. Hf6]